MRIDKREKNMSRPVEIVTGFQKYPDGSALISVGNTKVICAAHIEKKLPGWMENASSGWITAEYAMLPGAGQGRTRRRKNGIDGRSSEIQRLIGRSLRSIADLEKLGPFMISVDCDVLQADGGTRTASITGAFVALMLAFARMKQMGLISSFPVVDSVSAISCGMVAGEKLLDLCYDEDHRADIDANFVFSGKEKIIEIQSTAEGAPFERELFNDLYDLAIQGAREMTNAQKVALGPLWDEIG